MTDIVILKFTRFVNAQRIKAYLSVVQIPEVPFYDTKESKGKPGSQNQATH